MRQEGWPQEIKLFSFPAGPLVRFIAELRQLEQNGPAYALINSAK